MAISRTATVSVASADAGTNTTTIIESGAFTGVPIRSMVYNTTRSLKSKVTVYNSSSSLTLGHAVTGQTTGDAISVVPPIVVDGAYDTGTATSGTATTLTDTGGGFTASALIDRIIYISSGTGAGAQGLITANTTTVITVEAFYKFDTTTKNWTTITPDNTSVYQICYNCADVISAVGSVASWQDTTVAKTMVITCGFYVPSGGYFGDVDKRILCTYRDGTLDTTSGGFFQMGALNNSYNGIRGGSIGFELQASAGANYQEMYWLGRTHLFGTRVDVQKSYADSVNIHARVNLYSTTGDGLQLVNAEFTRIGIQCQAVDAIKGCVTHTGSTLYIEATPYHFTENIGHGQFPGVPRAESSATGANGGDVFDSTVTGTYDDGAVVRSPAFLFNFDQPKGVAYWWRSKVKSSTYSALTNLLTWYCSPTAVPSGHIWLGTTVDLTTYNSAGSALGSVAFGVVKQSDGTGQIVTAKGNSGANYAPTKKRFITTDGSGLYTGPFGSSEGVFVLCHKLYQTASVGTTPNTTSIKTDYGPYYVYFFKYGYKYSKQARAYAYNEGAVETPYMETNPYIAEATQATALAYSGLSTNGGTKVITVTGTRTIQELYDYTQAWVMNEMTANDTAYDEPLTTSDGVTFTLGSGWSIVVGASGVLTGLSDRIIGTVTVSSGGVYEDLDGMKYETGGTVRYCKHVYRNVKAVTGGSNISSAVVAVFDESGNDRTLNASRTAGGVLTNGSGNAEAYYIYKIDSTTYTLTEYIGKYGYDWLTVPIASTGTAIGSSGSYDTNRLVTDPYVTLTEANALLVSGVTANHTTAVIDGNANTYSQIQDNLKARQATTSEIESGKKGYISYYQEGHLMSYDGSFYTLSSGWIIEDTTFGGTLKDSILRLATPGTYNILLNSAQVNFEGTGTYDLRGATITTDITVDTITNATVTVQFSPGTSVTNNDPTNITVESSTSVTITINSVVAGSRIQIYDTDNTTELFNEIVAGTSFSDNFTYSVDTAIRVRLMYVTASAARKWWTTTGTITSAGFTATAAQEVNSVYATNGVDGSAVTECAINANKIDIQVDDPDNTTTAQRIYNWYQYYLFTEAGIRDSDSLITATDSTHYVFDNSVEIKNMDTVNPLNITGANIVPTSGAATDVFDLSNGASIAVNFNRVEGFAYSSGSGLSAGQAAQLTAIENKTANIQDNLDVATKNDVIAASQM